MHTWSQQESRSLPGRTRAGHVDLLTAGSAALATNFSFFTGGGTFFFASMAFNTWPTPSDPKILMCLYNAADCWGTLISTRISDQDGSSEGIYRHTDTDTRLYRHHYVPRVLPMQ